jgi:iron(III) transport system ATP-binding protein
VNAGSIATPFGPIAAPGGFGDGAAVEVVIRPEALRIATGAPGASRAQVTAARMLGRSSLIDLRVEEGGGAAPAAFRARVPGRFLPPVGSAVEIALDPIQTFVFPAESTTSSR